VQLEAVVRHYIKQFRPRSEAELDVFRKQASDESAVRLAALAEDDRGRRFSHQHRIIEEALRGAASRLVPATAELARQPNFGVLKRKVEALLEPVAGLGELYKYDTALRIGARFARLPREVYLHAGTRAGAAALGLDASQRFLFMSDLPAALRVLAPHEVEDVLCIYKGVLRDARLGRPVSLQDDLGCYLDDPEEGE